MSEVLEEIIKVYLEEGIVTQNNVEGLSSRAYARRIYKDLERSGYEEAVSMEVERDNYMDYSTVIFDPDRFTFEEVKKHMLKYVLI